jgi:catechol 2,3-dioxygenase-like lactoylglutathione lyase family enzyme
MEQRISLITLAVRDLAVSRRFYVDGLGWEAFLDVDDVLMLRVGEHLLQSLGKRLLHG